MPKSTSKTERCPLCDLAVQVTATHTPVSGTFFQGCPGKPDFCRYRRQGWTIIIAALDGDLAAAG